MNPWRMKDMKEDFATFPYRKLFSRPLNVFLYIKVWFLSFISFIVGRQRLPEVWRLGAGNKKSNYL